MKCVRFLTVALVTFLTVTTLNAQPTGLSAHVGYSPITFKEGSNNGSWTGLRVGIAAENLASTSVPLYVDYGLNFNYAWDSDNSVKDNYLSAAFR